MTERTKRFALQVIRLSASLPRTREASVICNQLLRSGTSIGANFAEAQNSRSKAEFAAKAGDSLKEAAETIYWLELLIEAGIVVQAQQAEEALQEARELKAILAAMIRNCRTARNGS